MVASYLARLCAALTLLVTIPMARQYLDAERFGVWMMLSSLLAFFAFADLGLGNGTLNRVTQALAHRDKGLASRIMRAGYQCTGALALALGLAWLVYTGTAQNPLAFAGRISAEHRQEVLTAFHLFVLLTLLNLPGGLVQKFQLGAQDGHWVGLGQGAASLGTMIALPLALYLHLELGWLVLASIGMQSLVNGISTLWWLQFRGYLGPLSRAQSSLALIRSLFATGAMFFVLQLCAAFAFQSDAFVIAQLRGQAEYGDFAAVQKVFLSCATLTSAALLGLWPAFADALGRQDFAWARKVLWRAMASAALVMGALGIGLTLSMPELSRVWLHMPVPPSIGLTVLLATWMLVETLGNIVGALLNGAGLVRPQMLAAVVMASVAFAAKWLLVDHWGPVGAVLATLLAYVTISVPTAAYLLHRLLQGGTSSPTEFSRP
jgi:O-antigen/teichoic acid export membrane protein